MNDLSEADLPNVPQFGRRSNWRLYFTFSAVAIGGFMLGDSYFNYINWCQNRERMEEAVRDVLLEREGNLNGRDWELTSEIDPAVCPAMDGFENVGRVGVLEGRVETSAFCVGEYLPEPIPGWLRRLPITPDFEYRVVSTLR